MNEKTINLGCVTACTLWVVTFLLITWGAVEWIAFGNDDHGVALMAFGLAFSAGAATATIRRYFVVQNRLLKDAFDLGRAARDSSSVRRLTH